MPVEIRELVIKARVRNKNTGSSGNGDHPAISEPLINEILDRVFRILEEKQQR